MKPVKPTRPHGTFKINGYILAIGDRVIVEVSWPNGRRTRHEGTLITAHGDEVFVETSLGAVVGDARTVEPI